MKKLLLFTTLFLLTAVGTSVQGRTEVTKTMYRNALILAYSQANNFYEDENIKLEIYDEKLYATNKTSKTIFIDLSQCFLVHNGSSFPMFDKKQNEKHASKKGVTTSVDEFLTIAPATGANQNATYICNMNTGFFGKYTTSEAPNGNFTDYDKRFIEMINGLVEETSDSKKGVCSGTATRHFTEDESVNNIGASIAYAFNKRAEEWHSVTLSTWVSDVVFAPCYVEMPKDLKKKDKKGFGVKETAPAKIHIRANSPFVFDEDKSPLIVADWEGDFKKGEFKLNTTYISKTKGKTAAFLLSGFTAGASLALIQETVYKRAVIFDGANANWGKLIYTNDINSTQQE